MLPKTGKEARLLGIPRYFTGTPCKRGHLAERYANNGHCIECDNARIKPADQRKKALDNYYTNNTEKAKKASVLWRKTSGKGYQYTKKSRLNNAGSANFFNQKRYAAKLQRTPPWLTKTHYEAIEFFYWEAAELSKLVGEFYTVDHIVPLQGKTVSGLHVPWNLQILTKSENSSKGNRL